MSELRYSSYNFCIENEERFLVYNSYSSTVIDSPYRMDSTIVNPLQFSKSTENKLYDLGILSDGECPELDRFLLKRDDIILDNILSVCIIVTNKCSFDCVYCYQNHTNERIARDTILNLCRYIKRNISKYRAVHISLFGGEPLEESDLAIDILDKIRYIVVSSNKLFSCSITSNGYFLSEKVVLSLKKLNCFYVQVTIDGPPEFHNKYRMNANGSPTFNTIYENIKLLLEHKIGVSLRINVTKENFSELPAFFRFLNSDIKSKQFSYYLYPVRDWGNSGLGTNSLIEDYTDLLEECLDMNNIKYDISSYMTPGGCICFGYYKNSFLLRMDGSLAKCTVETEEIYSKILSDGRIKSISYLNSLPMAPRISSRCTKCYLLGVCFGMPCHKKYIKNEECVHRIKMLPFIMKMALKQGQVLRMEDLL